MVITIFVRHSPDCKYAGDEFCKRCNCRKHLRWSQDGKQYRQTAGTRSWEAAEDAKRNLELQLSGKAPAGDLLPNAQTIAKAIEVFLQDKKNQGVTANVEGKYTRELARLRQFCEHRGVFVVNGITRELLTSYASTWADDYKASTTRSRVRDRLKTFLRYCFEAEWLPRLPKVSPVKVEQIPTLPLTTEEYERLLKAAATKFAAEPDRAARVRALLQLMRWSGLAIRDASTLIIHDKGKGLYRIVTSRQKTGTHVSVPIPIDVAQELLSVLNGNETYVFWSGFGDEDSQTKLWARHIARLFDDAKIVGGHMRSHRLRDTFAVDLLEKGVPLEEVSKLLGHESIKTTERFYAKWVKGRQDRLDTLVTDSWALSTK
jgi:integrase/recombinase XerD